MSRPSAEQVAQRAFDFGLVDERQLREIWGELGSHNVDIDDLLQLLVRREILTNYQVDLLLKGERSGFFFGDYKVLYLVGSGSFARVYRAVHRETDRVVAIKVLRRRYSENPLQYRQFIREGLLGRSLRHKNIVPIYEVVSEGTTHFFVMDFVEGRSLRTFIKIRKKIDPPEAIRLMSDISAGLQYAFERSLTHRDLKISNVLVSSRGVAKLVDFGLAAIDETTAGNIPADATNGRAVDYAALERATGVRRDDPRSDIYFLGCIFYHMLTGRPALAETRDPVQRLSKTRFLDVVPAQKVDPSLPHCISLIVNKAMMLDADRRYQTPGAMLYDLRSAARRLSQGDPSSGDSSILSSSQLQKASDSSSALTPRQSVMVVESNASMQDVFRSGFKKAGYRVLVTSDAERALTRILQEPTAVDCILINAQQIGPPAVEVFNRLADNEVTQSIPAALLLDEAQHVWQRDAKTAPHRVVVKMPITMKQLRELLLRLLPPVEA